MLTYVCTSHKVILCTFIVIFRYHVLTFVCGYVCGHPLVFGSFWKFLEVFGKVIIWVVIWFVNFVPSFSKSCMCLMCVLVGLELEGFSEGLWSGCGRVAERSRKGRVVEGGSLCMYQMRGMGHVNVSQVYKFINFDFTNLQILQTYKKNGDLNSSIVKVIL